jgi:hypothetical protein
MNVDETLENWFGVMDLTENHCRIWYYLSMITVFLMAFSVGRFSMSLFEIASKGTMKLFVFVLIMAVLSLGLYYFIYYLYRIQYAMCVKSAKKE